MRERESLDSWLGGSGDQAFCPTTIGFCIVRMLVESDGVAVGMAHGYGHGHSQVQAVCWLFFPLNTNYISLTSLSWFTVSL